MKYNKLEKYASKPRMDRFLMAAGAESKAVNLYGVNLRVAQAFYPILNLTEIFLRNSLYSCIETYLSDPDWIVTEKTGFMNDPSLAKSKYYLKNCITNAEDKMLRNGVSVSAGKILAEQSFGFWVSLFEPYHYRLIGGSVIHSFPYKPPHVNRKTILILLSKIRNFRNRIYHNEPICFNGTVIDFSYAIEVKEDIFELLSWMDTDVRKYVEQFNGIDKNIDSVKCI